MPISRFCGLGQAALIAGFFPAAASVTIPTPGYIWAIIGVGAALVLAVIVLILWSLADRFLTWWLHRFRYHWSRWRRKWFEARYLRHSLPVVHSLEEIVACLEQVTWTRDGPLHLFDAISYPQTVWAKKKDDCDGFAILAAALLRQWDPATRPVLVTAMLRPMRRSHTVCAFSVPDGGLWFFDNYSLRRGQFPGHAEVVAEFKRDARMVCWDVVEPETLQTIEFHTR
jgi:hypothetical protein